MTDKPIINGVDVRFYSDTKGFCDFCKDDIDSAIECPYENHCFFKCYSAYNKIQQKKISGCEVNND